MTGNQSTILVTGGCGYLGSQLLHDLGTNPVMQGATIRILDNMQLGGYRALMNLPKACHFEFIEGDILDPVTVRYALRDVTAVVHLAAIVRTPMSFESPTWLAQVNHWGTAHLIEACLESNVAHFIFASSTAVYGPGNHPKDDICRPQGAYAQSKYDAEKSIKVAVERGLRATILRFGTLFGLAPVTRFDAFVNRLVYLAGTKRSLTAFGSGQQKRPIIHVRDASSLITRLISDRFLDFGVYNIVSQNASVLDVIHAIQTEMPEVKVQFTEQDVRTHLSFVIESTLSDHRQWQPQQTLATGIEELLRQFHFAEITMAIC